VDRWLLGSVVVGMLALGGGLFPWVALWCGNSA
jgi:hypothetical protein